MTLRLPALVRTIGSLNDDPETELDRLLNDPDVPMSALRVWELLDQLAAENASSLTPSR